MFCIMYCSAREDDLINKSKHVGYPRVNLVRRVLWIQILDHIFSFGPPQKNTPVIQTDEFIKVLFPTVREDSFPEGSPIITKFFPLSNKISKTSKLYVQPILFNLLRGSGLKV